MGASIMIYDCCHNVLATVINHFMSVVNNPNPNPLFTLTFKTSFMTY